MSSDMDYGFIRIYEDPYRPISMVTATRDIDGSIHVDCFNSELSQLIRLFAYYVFRGQWDKAEPLLNQIKELSNALDVKIFVNSDEIVIFFY